jgi:hypothetical protein
MEYLIDFQSVEVADDLDAFVVDPNEPVFVEMV